MEILPRRFRRFAGALVATVVWTASGCLHAEWSWIWAPQAGADKAAVLRRAFDAPAGAREASLLVTCDNGARVTLNGEEVLENTDWNSPSQANVTRRLKAGRNELRAEAHNDDGPAAFLARLRFQTADGRLVTIETDESWEAALPGGSDWKAARVVARYGEAPWGDPLGLTPSRKTVVQPEAIQTLQGFRVELLHVVPKVDEGSWVSLTVDPKGRIIACDQYGSLYRVTPPPIGSGAEASVERLRNGAGGAHGLLYAFNSLYVMINEQGGRQGLWRLRDTDGDDQFDEETQLRRIDGGGEHGPHAIVLSPDRTALFVVCGNHTKLPNGLERSRAPRRWDEDQIVPRMWDANGHARGILAPGGYICRTDPDGKTFELVSAGYRNAFDITFNALGDLITYDSDMEWDAGTPWYRPTRICLATSGSEFGWRSGSGKWPEYYPDSLPALLDLGPGSPTGVESGAGALFPARYQLAVFANDWTYGTMYAIHLTPEGAAYHAEREEFLSGKPLPLTDLTINPRDGALYFAIGGRRTQSALYRVSYSGPESTVPASPPAETPEHALRRRLEALHAEGTGPEAIGAAWPQLAHADRWVRFAARVAIERQPTDSWAHYFFEETRPWAVLEGAVALARIGEKQHRAAILAQLDKLDFASLNSAAKLALIRAYELVLLRLGIPEGEWRNRTIARLDALFPAPLLESSPLSPAPSGQERVSPGPEKASSTRGSPKSSDPERRAEAAGIAAALNRELAETLIALEAPTAVAKTMQLMATARNEDLAFGSESLLARNSGYADPFNKAASTRPNRQQIAYAFALRNARTGWTPALRRSYFAWFPRTSAWQGGNSFRGFLQNTRKEALALVPDEAERKTLDELSSRTDTARGSEEFPPPKGPGRDYSVDDILSVVGSGLRGRNFESGRSLFHAAACFSCHPFAGAGGGVGPDLTGSGSRFSLRDLLENIIEPSKVISDQYGSEQIETTDGAILIGRAYEENGRLYVVFDPRNPDEKESIEISKVKSRKPYPVSLMPQGLLNSMNTDEILNLLAYIQSAGDSANATFRTGATESKIVPTPRP